MENSNSRSGSRKGTMSDRGSPEKDADDRPPSIAGPRDRAQLPIKPNYFKPNGLRMSVINPRLSGSSRDSEDLVATGTNWMPLPSEKPRTTRSGQSVNNGISNGSSQVAGPFPPKRTNSRSTANQGSSTQYSGSNRKSKDTEPKYPDPMVGATTASFQTRIAELNALEVETIRWEKSRKFKKKPKQDS
ncbi:uncharacterized protein LOC106172021 [Lingula anatina]|uniref:Uncharacterized protein LOC106172021 n=1 Tax=Lingula anatina TaxID=7574 RepID=A0A1S3JCZ7_LINAN|nr:uncharacterized protein LOC106172021 [Lingula anatina]|eukprot:XP_013408051.1 uncharacterized protein LOC106172021 [Lingula anatina]